MLAAGGWAGLGARFCEQRAVDAAAVVGPREVARRARISIGSLRAARDFAAQKRAASRTAARLAKLQKHPATPTSVISLFSF